MESRLPEREAVPSPKNNRLEGDFLRTQIGISIADPINRGLVEGVAAQLGLIPVFLEEAELVQPERMQGVELLIADESRALRFRQAAGIPEDPREGIRPAVVAAVSASSTKAPVLPSRSRERPFDGMLVLPQQPAMVLAELSVILYAHRRYALPT
jgi:two-component system sporulation sensor kinase C